MKCGAIFLDDGKEYQRYGWWPEKAEGKSKKEKIQKLLESDLISDEIAKYSGITYTTAKELKDGITSIDEASFRTQVKLTYGYKIAFEGYEPEEKSLTKRIANVEVATNINKIDGIMLSNECIEKKHNIAYGRIKRSEFSEHILQKTLKINYIENKNQLRLVFYLCL